MRVLAVSASAGLAERFQQALSTGQHGNTTFAYHEHRSEHRNSCITGGNARPCARSSVRLPSLEQKCSKQAAAAAQTSSASSFRCTRQHQSISIKDHRRADCNGGKTGMAEIALT